MLYLRGRVTIKYRLGRRKWKKWVLICIYPPGPQRGCLIGSQPSQGLTSICRWDPSQLPPPPRPVFTVHFALGPSCLLVSSQTGPGRELCSPLPGECYLMPGVKRERTELSTMILQARILEWVAMTSSRGSSNPGIEPRSPALHVDSLPSEPPGKPKNTGVGSLSLLQRIFLTQESNRGLLHCRWILYQLSHQGSPRILEWVAYPYPGDLPNPGIEPGFPALRADSLPAELPGKL